MQNEHTELEGLSEVALIGFAGAYAFVGDKIGNVRRICMDCLLQVSTVPAIRVRSALETELYGFPLAISDDIPDESILLVDIKTIFDAETGFTARVGFDLSSGKWIVRSQKVLPKLETPRYPTYIQFAEHDAH